MKQDVQDFRRALGQFATGVAIVSAKGPAGEPVGITVSSFNSVSLEPPLVLFSVARTAHSLPAMISATGFVINILSQDQADLSTRFSKPSTEKWHAVACTTGHTEAPVINDTLAYFECRPYAHHDGGDHVIFVGRVIRFHHASEAEPLLFFRGRYRGLQSEQQSLE